DRRPRLAGRAAPESDARRSPRYRDGDDVRRLQPPGHARGGGRSPGRAAAPARRRRRCGHPPPRRRRGDQVGRDRRRVGPRGPPFVRRRVRVPRQAARGAAGGGGGRRRGPRTGREGRGMSIFKPLTRILAIVGKELVSVIRRPGALLSLVLGPFLIMAIFGAGYSGYRRPRDPIVVVPRESGLPTDVDTYAKVGGEVLRIVGVVPTADAAMDKLARQDVDVVLV